MFIFLQKLSKRIILTFTVGLCCIQAVCIISYGIIIWHMQCLIPTLNLCLIFYTCFTHVQWFFLSIWDIKMRVASTFFYTFVTVHVTQSQNSTKQNFGSVLSPVMKLCHHFRLKTSEHTIWWNYWQQKQFLTRYINNLQWVKYQIWKHSDPPAGNLKYGNNK